jgi:hypothetical protein
VVRKDWWNQMKKEEDRALPDALKVGDFVSWDSAGGRARGKIIKIERDGKINIPNSEFTLQEQKMILLH